MLFSKVRQRARTRLNLESDLNEIKSRGDPNHTIAIYYLEKQIKILERYEDSLPLIPRAVSIFTYQFQVAKNRPKLIDYTPSPLG